MNDLVVELEDEGDEEELPEEGESDLFKGLRL